MELKRICRLSSSLLYLLTCGSISSGSVISKLRMNLTEIYFWPVKKKPAPGVETASLLTAVPAGQQRYDEHLAADEDVTQILVHGASIP